MYDAIMINYWCITVVNNPQISFSTSLFNIIIISVAVINMYHLFLEVI